MAKPARPTRSTKRRRSPRAPTPEHVVADSTWTEGDLTLLSSDGVRFRVPSAPLLACSPALSAALTSDTLALTDPALECAAVLRPFLAFALKLDTAQVREAHRRTYLPASSASPFVAVARLMAKWGCALELRRLSYVFEREGRGYPGAGRDAFVVSALAGDTAACCRAIEGAAPDYTRAGGEAFVDRCALVPANVPPAVREIVPPAYWAALVKGWERSGKHRNRREWAYHFELLVQGAK
ncbi:hypothetical protein Q8F55_002718 [Vanrija albida]|uniref:BTB domain-containing protein n=1 Tax=Vanrija albida TaxID=181172 RepID=A0ABR3QBK2_9TREE